MDGSNLILIPIEELSDKEMPVDNVPEAFKKSRTKKPAKKNPRMAKPEKVTPEPINPPPATPSTIIEEDLDAQDKRRANYLKGNVSGIAKHRAELKVQLVAMEKLRKTYEKMKWKPEESQHSEEVYNTRLEQAKEKLERQFERFQGELEYDD